MFSGCENSCEREHILFSYSNLVKFSVMFSYFSPILNLKGSADKKLSFINNIMVLNKQIKQQVSFIRRKKKKIT